MVDVSLGNVCVEVLTFNESQEEFIDNLYMRPSHFKDGFILLRVKRFALRCHGRRDGTEQVLGEHLHDTRIHGLRDDRPVVGDIVQELMESQSLDLFGFHVGSRIVEIKNDVALINLLHKEVLAPVGSHLVEAWQLFQLALTLIGDVESG